MDEPATKDYRVTFDVVMPGQTRKTSYPIDVKADSKVEALARAESEYEKIALAYEVSIRENKPTI